LQQQQHATIIIKEAATLFHANTSTLFVFCLALLTRSNRAAAADCRVVLIGMHAAAGKVNEPMRCYFFAASLSLKK
jgi:hypothetical protein